MHFVMWWVEDGHRPTLEEALGRLEMLKANGNSKDAFGWDGLDEAKLWRERACA